MESKLTRSSVEETLSNGFIISSKKFTMLSAFRGPEKIIAENLVSTFFSQANELKILLPAIMCRTFR